MNNFVSIQTNVQTTKNIQLQISEDVLFALLKLDKYEVRNLKAFVRTTGMYDNCSNMDINLNDCKLIVQYDTVDDVISTKLMID